MPIIILKSDNVLGVSRPSKDGRLYSFGQCPVPVIFMPKNVWDGPINRGFFRFSAHFYLLSTSNTPSRYLRRAASSNINRIMPSMINYNPL